MTLWTAKEAATATGGCSIGDWAASGVSIDTRSLTPGDLFVALQAARDGHDFVAQALAKGASAALVSHIPKGVSEDAPLLIVPDVMAALTALGSAGRARARAHVIAVTGSVGKTSTKEMLREMLSDFGVTHAAEASFNNHWGVPVTLARLRPDADFAVIEIGMNRPGEIEPLSRLARPHVALVTTIAPAHLEAFEDISGIAQEKASIFRGLDEDAHAIFPCDLPTFPILKQEAVAAKARLCTFGESSDHARLSDMAQSEAGLVMQAELGGQHVTVSLADAGMHFGMNALACLAVAQALGLDIARAAAALGRWHPPVGRGSRETIFLDRASGQQFTLIDDAFNANPASLEAALNLLAALTPEPGPSGQTGRRVAILGDMLELGAQELQMHEAVAAYPSLAKVDVVHCVGHRMAALHACLPSHQRGLQVLEAKSLAEDPKALVAPGDIVLVKGSKSIFVSRVVHALRELGSIQPQPKGK